LIGPLCKRRDGKRAGKQQGGRNQALHQGSPVRLCPI
jgi:hypothetical protein